MNEPIVVENCWLMLAPAEAAPPERHTLEAAAAIAGLHPELLRHYCRLGLFGPVRSDRDGEPEFDDGALRELRRFEDYRTEYRLRRRALRLVWDLWLEGERLRGEMRYLRGG